MGNDNPMSHPNTIRQTEAVGRILKETNGRVKISGFPTDKAGWAVVDGDLGSIIRASVEMAGLHAFEKVWDNGFREISSTTHPIRTPDDPKGYKIRVQVSPLWTSVFEAFGAALASINFSEVYSALQTKIIEGKKIRSSISKRPSCTRCRNTSP
jgi:TRAP-type C4-dicarboxylate transport system substrate-binding protein